MQYNANKSIRKIAPVAAVAFVATMLVGAFSFTTTTAWAAVTFDPETGEGFVGKGDVQDAFGWNNAQLQQRASDVDFIVESTATYEFDCVWQTGPAHNRQTHSVDRDATTEVNSDIAYDPRQVKGQKQITGFNLLGYGDTNAEDAPVNGQLCSEIEGVDANPDSRVENVELVSQSGSNLFVVYGNNKVALN